MKFDFGWRMPIVGVAIAGTAIAGGVVTNAGTISLAAPDQTPVVKQMTVPEVGMPRTVRLVGSTLSGATHQVKVRSTGLTRGELRSHKAARDSASESTATVVIVAGARIRTRPVTGTVVGLVRRGDWFYVECKSRASDGYVWGRGHNNGRWGWMRDDLWDVIYFTAPGAPSPRPIPWC